MYYPSMKQWHPLGAAFPMSNDEKMGLRGGALASVGGKPVVVGGVECKRQEGDDQWEKEDCQRTNKVYR